MQSRKEEIRRKQGGSLVATFILPATLPTHSSRECWAPLHNCTPQCTLINRGSTTQTRTCVHARTHMYARTHARTHTHTHTHILHTACIGAWCHTSYSVLHMHNTGVSQHVKLHEREPNIQLVVTNSVHHYTCTPHAGHVISIATGILSWA